MSESGFSPCQRPEAFPADDARERHVLLVRFHVAVQRGGVAEGSTAELTPVPVLVPSPEAAAVPAASHRVSRHAIAARASTGISLLRDVW